MRKHLSEQVKKEMEQEALNCFLDVYETVTHQTLEVLESTERPDFICMRQNGERVGLELVKVRRSHPNDILWDEIIEKQNHMALDLALEMIQKVAVLKDKKRNEPDWELPEAAILLIELRDISLLEIKSCISEQVLPDLFSAGFAEIWLADFSGLEAYDNIELFCIKPDKFCGYYPRGIQKPYG